MLNFYPLFIALAGFVVAALLSERAISLMQPDAKAALVDASARSRLLNILVGAVFLGLTVALGMLICACIFALRARQ